MTSLVNNLGGAAGFGEFSLARNDDGSSSFIDLRSVFGTQGVDFFGSYYTGLYVNNNGSVSFAGPISEFTPEAITGSTANPIIAAFWADIDTNGGAVTPSPGGTSTGSNLVWYDLDAANRTFTVTWDDVGYFSAHTDKTNAFQLSIHEIDQHGNFDVTFRYENIDWTTGDASGGTDGLGGTVARAGYSAGDGVDYLEFPQSGNQDGMLALDSTSNVGIPGTYIFTVRNGVPTGALSVGDASVVEGNGTAPRYITIPVYLTAPLPLAVTVHYATADGSALAGQDYVAQNGVLTFAAGQVRQDILIAVIGDTVAEGNESFTVTLSNPSTGATIYDGTGTATILDDDSTLSITARDAVKDEGNSGSTALTFTVTRTGSAAGAASAHWAVSGIAVNGADFVGGVLPSGTVSFAAGETRKIITVNVAGDTTVEADERFTVTLSDPSNGIAIGKASAAGMIRNDDVPSVSIAATKAVHREGNSGTTPFTFTVTRSGDSSSAGSVHWTVGGSAVTGSDFTGGALPTGVVTFAAGETSKVIAVRVAGDAIVEADESFTVTLSNPSAGMVIGAGSAVGTIRNDDASLSIAATDADKAEGRSGTTPFTFTVTRSGDSSRAASADWMVSGSAVDGADFAGGVLPKGSVHFAAGQTTATITIGVAGDTILEANERFTVTLCDPSDGTSIGTASASGRIRNDDTAVSISAVSADKAEGNLGATPFTFAVTRSGDLGRAGSVDWAVGGCDVGSTDFIPLTQFLDQAETISYLTSTVPGFSLFGDTMPSGTVRFAAGEASKTITVWVLGETLVEGDEKFNVTLSNPTGGAVLGTASAVGTIRNDDGSADRAAGQASAPAQSTLVATAGRDIFTFDQPLVAGHVATIVGFDPANDRIALSRNIFADAGPAGSLKAVAFFAGAAAHDASDRVIYNAGTGALSYDPDGSGGAAAHTFATVAPGLSLAASNFKLV